MESKLVTILTPVYNREKEVSFLFESLKKQSCYDFIWMIVDDGSTDNVKELVESFINRADFPIEYYYKTNGGKHTALNVGIKNIITPLVFIVDSDDVLTVDAVEQIKVVHSKYYNNEELCGYVFLRKFVNGNINGKYFKRNELIDTYINVRINSDDRNSDKAEVYKSLCLKEFPFPEYHGEKFLGEDIVWVRLARQYKMLHLNKAIYVGDYLEGGLTNTRRIQNIKSPRGCMDRAAEFMESDINCKTRIKSGIQYIVYGLFANYTNKQLISNNDNKVISCLSIIPGNLIYRVWRKKYNIR